MKIIKTYSYLLLLGHPINMGNIVGVWGGEENENDDKFRDPNIICRYTGDEFGIAKIVAYLPFTDIVHPLLTTLPLLPEIPVLVRIKDVTGSIWQDHKGEIYECLKKDDGWYLTKSALKYFISPKIDLDCGECIGFSKSYSFEEVEKVFDASRDRIPHPDWDYIHDEAADYLKSLPDMVYPTYFIEEDRNEINGRIQLTGKYL